MFDLTDSIWRQTLMKPENLQHRRANSPDLTLIQSFVQDQILLIYPRFKTSTPAGNLNPAPPIRELDSDCHQDFTCAWFYTLTRIKKNLHRKLSILLSSFRFSVGRRRWSFCQETERTWPFRREEDLRNTKWPAGYWWVQARQLYRLGTGESRLGNFTNWVHFACLSRLAPPFFLCGNVSNFTKLFFIFGIKVWWYDLFRPWWSHPNSWCVGEEPVMW